MDVQYYSPSTHSTDLDEALRRARADYVEMPGLRLTSDQARRLWVLDGSTCTMVLASLVASGSLSRSNTGAFVARQHNDR